MVSRLNRSKQSLFMRKNIAKITALALVGLCFALVSMRSYSEIKKTENPNAGDKVVFVDAKKKDGTDKSFAEIISEFKGSVVYVDFWASWCGPCRGQFPHAKKLHEKLKDKPVVFLYISFDRSEDEWKEGVDQFELSGYHWYPTENQQQLIYNQFQVDGIPRYLLIDKNGKVINADANRPSSSTILADITKLL